MPTTLIFMRHGQAMHNVAAETNPEAAYTSTKYQDAPLTELGKTQALDRALALKETFGHLDMIYTSPLTRCLQTAMAVKEILPVSIIVTTDNIIERQGGGHVCNDRKSRTEIGHMFPEVYLDIQESAPISLAKESYQNISSRLGSFLSKLPRETSDTPRNILIVTHCDFIYGIFGKVIGNAEVIIQPFKDDFA